MSFGLGFGQPSFARNPLTTAAANILRSFGTDAHVYLPGVGVINGLTAGNYLDSIVGPLVAVDEVVGRVNDAAGSVGANTYNGANFAQANNAVANTIVSGVSWEVSSPVGAAGNISNGALLSPVSPALTSGKTYAITVSASAAHNMAVYDAGFSLVASAINSSSMTFVAGASGTHRFYVAPRDTSLLAFSGVSIREVTGIHATQTTTASKPTVRKTGNNYYWQFDGTADYLALGAPLFQMADDSCTIAGFSVTTTAGNNVIAFPAGLAAGTHRISGLTSSTSTTAGWYDGTTFNSVTSPTVLNTPRVATAVKVGSTGRLRLNGATVGSTVITASFIPDTGLIGYAVGGAFFPGSIYPVIAIKGTVSDADLLILERWVGSLTGPTGVTI